MKSDDSDTAVTPTRAELVILNVLWKHGHLTVRSVHERMPRTKSCGYTTVLKLLQIMHGKGLVRRDTSKRAHVYRPVSDKSTVQMQLTSELVRQAFDDSPAQLIMRALEQSGRFQSEDIDAIRARLKLLEDRRRKK
ncbi:MAG: BlaI/MecI/CopY family transcriptional regulator [Gammaproteobacteria bacterium]|nr:BlaI/MecI/CopY family transcriptional regulator [Gammaproteobacteria bacterium]